MAIDGFTTTKMCPFRSFAKNLPVAYLPQVEPPSRSIIRAGERSSRGRDVGARPASGLPVCVKRADPSHLIRNTENMILLAMHAGKAETISTGVVQCPYMADPRAGTGPRFLAPLKKYHGSVMID